MTTEEDTTVTTKTSVATTVDTRTGAELGAAVIAGDASITAEQLAAARARQDVVPQFSDLTLSGGLSGELGTVLRGAGGQGV